MPKSKKKYYRNAARPATANRHISGTPATSADVSAPVKAVAPPVAARTQSPAVRATVMDISQSVGAELRVISLLSLLIVGAIVVLSFVLR